MVEARESLVDRNMKERNTNFRISGRGSREPRGSKLPQVNAWVDELMVEARESLVDRNRPLRGRCLRCRVEARESLVDRNCQSGAGTGLGMVEARESLVDRN